MFGMSAKDRLAMFEKKSDNKKSGPPPKKIGKLNSGQATAKKNSTEDHKKIPASKGKENEAKKPVAKDKAQEEKKMEEKKDQKQPEVKEDKAVQEKEATEVKKDEKAKVEPTKPKAEEKPVGKVPEAKDAKAKEEVSKTKDEPKGKEKPEEKKVEEKSKQTPAASKTPEKKEPEKPKENDKGALAKVQEKPKEAPKEKEAVKEPAKPAEKPAHDEKSTKKDAPVGKQTEPEQAKKEPEVKAKPAEEKKVETKAADAVKQPAAPEQPKEDVKPQESKPAVPQTAPKESEKVKKEAETKPKTEEKAAGKPTTQEKVATKAAPKPAASQGTIKHEDVPSTNVVMTMVTDAPKTVAAKGAIEHKDVPATDIVMTVVHEKTASGKVPEKKATTAEAAAKPKEAPKEAGAKQDAKEKAADKKDEVKGEGKAAVEKKEEVQVVKETPAPAPPAKREPEYKPIPEEFYDNLFYFSGMGTLVGTALSKGVYVPPRATRTALEVEMIENYESLKDEERKMDVRTIKKARNQAVDLAEELRKLQALLGGLPSFGGDSSGTSAAGAGSGAQTQPPPFIPFQPLGPPRRLETPKEPVGDQTSPRQSALNLISQSAKTVAESTPDAPLAPVMNGPASGASEKPVQPAENFNVMSTPPVQPAGSAGAAPGGDAPGSSVGVFRGDAAATGVPWQERYGQSSVEDAHAPRPFGPGGAIPGGLKPWQLSHLRGLEVRGYEFSHERPESGADYSDTFYHGGSGVVGHGQVAEDDHASLAPFLVSNRSQSADRDRLLRSRGAVSGSVFHGGPAPPEQMSYSDV